MSASLLSLEILPEGLMVKTEGGSPLPEVLRHLRIPINYPCGGRGTCGRCRVHFHAGAPFPSAADHRRLLMEELAAGERLACQCELEHNARVEIPNRTRLVEPRVLASPGEREIPLMPWILRVYIELDPPTVEDPVSDTERVSRVLKGMNGAAAEFSLEAIRQLPAAIARGTASLILSGNTVIDIQPGEDDSPVLGVAVDIGTTTVAASLHCLRSGRTLAVAGRLNPQVELGEDVVSRLTFAYGSPERLLTLQARVVACINTLVERLCREAGVGSDSVRVYTLAGNAAMNHMLLAVTPDQIAVAPYTPAFSSVPLLAAGQIGLDGHAGARAFVFPNIGGFVGGDTVAGLLACDFDEEPGRVLFIDIGTNCEVVLRVDDTMLAASAPAGPALEGACISCGRRAEPGAVCDVCMDDGTLHVKSIDDLSPNGLCGSGLVHIVHALRSCGIVAPSGIFADPEKIADPGAARLARKRLSRDSEGKLRFQVGSKAEGAEVDFFLTQRDIREFQLAKAAIAASWQMLCLEAGIEPESIDRVYIAGAFGNYIRGAAALDLGMVPPVGLDRIRSVGNTSLEGARLALLNRGHLDRCAGVLANTRFVELAGREDFQEVFALEMSM